MNRSRFFFEMQLSVNLGSVAAPVNQMPVVVAADSDLELVAMNNASDLKGSILLASGYPISSRTDGLAGEKALVAILRSMERGDLNSLEEFDGPFIAAVFVASTRKLTIARDKFGLRSAFFKISRERLCISDDASIFDGKNDVRINAISEWLHYGAPLAPLTLFHGIKVVEPGSALEISLDDWSIVKKVYFKPEDYIKPTIYNELKKIPDDALAKKFNYIFNDVISKSLQGHDNATILLSGGVDSSLLTAFARHHAKITAVTVDIYGPGAISEVRFATAVAEKLGVQLDVVRFGPAELIHGFCKTISDLGTPLIIENAVALNYLARAGSLPSGQLILDGEGADALMAGSTSLFKYSMMVRHLTQITAISGINIRKILELLRNILGKMGVSTKTTLDGAGLDIDLAARRLELTYLESRIKSKFEHLSSQEDVEIASLMLREFYDYLVPLMLRIDKMSVACNSHTILPYLGKDVFEFLANLEMRHKIERRGWSFKPTSKAFLKERLEDYLTKELVYRPKVGFGIPGWNWIQFPEIWRRDCWIAEFFELNLDAVDYWINTTTNRNKIFFISLEIWGRLFARGIPLQVVEQQWLERN